MRRCAPLRSVPVVLAAVLATACGSTVQGSINASGTAGANAPVAGGNGLGGPTALQPGGDNAPGATSVGAAAGSGSVGSGSSATSSSTAAAVTGTNTGVGGSSRRGTEQGSSIASGPGVTATTIYVGMVYATNGDAVNKAAGANGISQGDPQADGRAVVNDINKHGGIAGRKIVPVWATIDATSTQTLDQQYAAVCAKFTQDNPRVFAAVVAAGVDSFRRCLYKAGVVQVDADLPQLGAKDFQRYPSFVELGYPNPNRLAVEMVTALADQKYFSGWDATLGQPSGTKAKVGIVTYDDAAYSEAVNGFLVPGLKRLGFDPMVERIGQIKTASDYSSQAAAVQNAELKFASNGVDHVIMFEANGGLSLFFMNQASSQHYHPRYGVNSSSATEYLLNAGDIQADQAKGAVGYGWIPGVDVTADRNPDSGPYSSPARRRCVKVFNDNGIKFADGNAEAVALEYCATLWLLQRALASKPSVINASTFVQGVEAIGSTFDAPGSLGETLGPGRHDGTSKIYYWRWFDDCGCLHYDGPRRTIP